MSEKDLALKNEKAGKALVKVAFLAVLLNLLLAAAKYFLGRFCGSLSLQADALHSLTDVVGSLSVLLGLKFAERKTATFPYGLYKLENLAALVSASFIFFAAYEIVKEALRGASVILPQRVPWAILGLTVMAVVTWLFSRWEARLARLSGSPSLAADAEHMKSEFLTMGVILAGLVGGTFGFSWADRVAALFVSAIIFRIGWRIFVDSLKVLLDAGLEPETLTKIADIIRAFPEVVEIKRLTGRRSGRFRFIEAEIVLDVASLDEAHEIVTMIEEEIYDHFPDIDRVVIHFEPPQVEEYVLAVPIDEDGDLCPHFGCAPAFLLLRIDCRGPRGRVKEERILPNPYAQEDRRRGIRVAEWLQRQGVQAVLIPKEEVRERGFLYALAGLGLRPYFRSNVSLEELKRNPPCPSRIQAKNVDQQSGS
ncbi:MAG: cation diffusion facilitator family transporter [Thermodesulfobacteria bacterium]|nr:cation diffusion facilitator family transporter [Thermodesulfobacteriota bacterium]